MATLKLSSVSLKTVFSMHDISYEIAVESHCPQIDYNGTMTWVMSELHVEKGIFVADLARRINRNNGSSRLTLHIEGENLRIIDADGDRTFVGDKEVLQKFSNEIFGICQ